MTKEKNKRADRVWLRLIQAYGSRVAENYGKDVPESWVEEIDKLLDEQIGYGLKAVTRQSPIHPPTQGQFVQACLSMPVEQLQKSHTLMEQLCAYATQRLHMRLPNRDFSAPWVYFFREGWDASRPKGFERTAECLGVVIESRDGTSFKITVAEMLGDPQGHQRALASFRPGPKPTDRQMQVFHSSREALVEKMRDAGAEPKQAAA